MKAALREAEATLPADVVINTDLFQLKSFIDRGIYYVEEALVIGAVLVVIVLFLFLLNLRTTFITLTAIPLSLVITTLVFRLIGTLTGTELSINVMTLGGIAVAMGELVDDAIVDVENIFRRLSENNALPTPKPALLVVYEASREIRSAIVFGTAVVILAFMPLFALSGVEGRLFTPLGIAYIVSILASLLVSLTVTPVLSYYLLPQSKATHRHHDGLLLRSLKWAASYLIRFSMRHAGVLLLLTWVLVGFSVWQLTRLGADFLPKFDEGSVQINVALPGGSSLKASNEVSDVIDAKLQDDAEVAGQPERPDPALRPPHRPGRTRRTRPAGQRRRVHPDDEPGRRHAPRRVPEDGAGRPAGRGAGRRDRGRAAALAPDQPHALRRQRPGRRQDLRRRPRQAPATGRRGPLGALPKCPASRRRSSIRRSGSTSCTSSCGRTTSRFYGISREYVADFVQTALKGEAVSKVLEGQRRFDLVVKLQEPYRSDPDFLKELRLDLPERTRPDSG